MENLKIKRIQGFVWLELGLSLMGCVLWEAEDCFKLLDRENEPGVKELDSCNSIYKETCCPVTQDTDILITWSPI